MLRQLRRAPQAWQRRGFRVLAMGNTIIDNVISVEKLPDDGKVWVESKRKFVGGQGANAAQGMAKLGLQVSWLSRLGDDDDGMNALRHFKSCGIDTSLCIEIAHAHTMSATVTIGRECMKRCCYMHKDERLLEYDISQRIQGVDVHSFEVLYTDGHQTDLALPIARRAAEHGVPVISDIEVLDHDCRELAKLATHLIAPLEVLQELSGEIDPGRAVSSLLDRPGKTVIATAGIDGSYGTYFEDRTVHHVKVRPECQAFDTLGAGDAYHAGYVAGVSRGLELRQRMALATSVAAALCETPGPVPSIEALRRFGCLSDAE